MTVGRIPSVEGGIQPTIVDAKGDLIAAVAADSLNRLAVGSNDQVLVADSAASTGLAWKSYGAQVVAGKNAVINGAFDIYQRTSTPTTGITVTSGIAYTIDRWTSWTIDAGGSCTTSRQTTSDTTNLPFIRYCARFQRVAGNTNTGILALNQVLENADSTRFVGQSVTFSFYARRGANFSAASNILSAAVISGTGTDQAINTLSGGAYVINSNATLTSTWQRFTFTGTVATSAAQIGFQFQYTPVGTAGANDYFEVTGVQLELGSTATTFSRAGGTIQGELAACQRYYWNISGDNQMIGAGWYQTATEMNVAIKFPTTMRTSPTLTVATGTNYYDIKTNGTIDTFNDLIGTAAYVGADQVMLYTTSNVSGTAGRAGGVRTNNASAKIEFSAEL